MNYTWDSNCPAYIDYIVIDCPRTSRMISQNPDYETISIWQPPNTYATKKRQYAWSLIILTKNITVTPIQIIDGLFSSWSNGAMKRLKKA